MNIINANQVSQKLLQILTKASLENLNAGDILQGRVQSLENGMLLLKLLDGAFFTAKAPESFSASPGELITLEIGEKINDQLTAKILPSDSQKQQPAKTNEQALKAAIVEKLISVGASQPEKLVSNVLSLLRSEPGLPVDQAAFIAANKLDISPEMMKLIQKISEHEFQLQDNLQSLKDGLKNTISQMDGSAREAVLKPLMISQALDGLAKHLKQMLPDASSAQKESIIQHVRALITKTLLVEFDETADNSGNLMTDAKDLKGMISKAVNSIKDGISLFEEGAGRPMMKPEIMDHLLETVRKVLEDVHTRSGAWEKSGQKDIEALLDNLFDKAIIKVENGKAEDVDIRDKAKALKEVMDFSQKLLNVAEAKSHEAILTGFKEIDSAFRFFNQVTTYDAMLQLPIRINNSDTTGELYVMKRRSGRKKLDTDNFTLFLSLQTVSLGRIESFLNSSRKCVTISFRVEDEDLVKLVKDNHRMLYDNLLKKGYKLAEMKCRVLEDDRTGLLDAARNAQEFLGLQAKVDIKL